MSDNYEDIIHLSRPVSKKHIPMSRENRAAQFAPFAALTGHEEALEETARLTDRQLELEDYDLDRLDSTLRVLRERLATRSTNANAKSLSGPRVAITYFVPDQKKTGGKYLTATGTLKKILDYERVLVLEDLTTIPFLAIADMEILDS